MAEQQHKGLMQLLTSRDISWTKRVKLLRYAWTNDSVVVPNKRPFLLHLITTGLINRRKDLSADENQALWRCSRDVLQAACSLSVVNASNDVYSLKISFVQLILNELQQLSSSSPIDTDHCAIVVSCCHALVTSPILGLDLTSKFENMLKLLTSVLQLLMRVYDGHLSNTRDQIESLLVVTTPHYTACQRQKSGSSQLAAISICTKLFMLYMRLTYWITCCPSLQVHSNIVSCHQDLEESLISAVFSKDLSLHYGAFLQRKIGKVETGWKESRYISVLFDAVTSAFINEETRPAAVRGISWVYTTFTNCYKESNPEFPLLFLRYLCDSFCFDKSLTVDDVSDTSVKPAILEKACFGTDFIPERLEVLHLLLKSTLSTNVFDAVYDRSNDNLTLHWLQSVAAWLLLQKSRCKDWFLSLHDLLLLSPAAVESRLVALINAVWTVDPSTLNGDARQAQCDLLVEIVHSFTRMRQVGRLMHAMLLSVRIATGCVHMHGSFRDSVHSCFADLDGMTVMDIWLEFNTELSTQYEDISINDLCSSRVQAVCELLSMLILNVTAIGHSINKVAESKLDSLLQTTRLYVLSQLEQTCLKKKTEEGACTLMMLLHACGNMILVRQAYGLSDGKLGSSLVDRTFHDLSLLHSNWDSKNWSKLHRFVIASANLQLMLCWVKLIIQGVQYDRCCFKVMSSQLIREVNDFIFISDRWEICKTTASPLQVNVFNDLATHWSTALDNVTLLIPADSTPSVHVEAIARFLLCALTSPQTEGDVCCSLLNVAKDFISTPVFLEMQSLHSCIVTSVVGRILACLGKFDTPKFKRRKHAMDYENILHVLKLIGDLNDGLMPNEDGSVTIPSELVQEMNEILKQKDGASCVDLSQDATDQLCSTLKVSAFRLFLANLSSLVAAYYHTIIRKLEILKVLPLEYLDITSQIKCILSMVILAATLTCHTTVGPMPILSDVLQIVQCMLFDGQGIHSLMNSLGPGSVLQWFFTLRLRITVQNANCADVLRICDDVLRRLVRLSTKHSTMITHLADLVLNIKQQLRENRKSSGDHQTTKFLFRTLSMVLEVVTKVLRRPYIRPENLTAFRAMNDSIMKELTKCLTDLNDDTKVAPSTDISDDHTSSWLLLGYSCQLEYASLQSNASSKEDDALVRNKVLKFLPSMCGKCIANLQQTQSYDIVTSCARLIVVLCSCYASLRDQLPDNFLNDVWPLIVSRLRMLDPHPSLLVHGRSRQYLYGNNERTYLETTLAAMVTVSETFTVRQRLEELQSDMESGEDRRVTAALQVYGKLVQNITLFPDDVIKAILPSCLKVLLITQRLQMVPTTNKHVIFAVLNMKTAMLSASWSDNAHTKPVITSNLLSLCLHPCSAIELQWTMEEMDTLVAICRSWHELLNAVLIYHSAIVYRMVPAFIGGVRQLLRAIMQAGTQHADQKQRYNDRQLDMLTDCTRLFDRLASLICSHKINFAKAVPYVVADYVNVAQKVTLYPVVKRTLLLAVYKLLDICGEHTIRQLNTVLPPGAREVFRIVYANFDKYYRYSRRATNEDLLNVEFIRTVYNS